VYRPRSDQKHRRFRRVFFSIKSVFWRNFHFFCIFSDFFHFFSEFSIFVNFFEFFVSKTDFFLKIYIPIIFKFILPPILIKKTIL
jgi:hypothetical protein